MTIFFLKWIYLETIFLKIMYNIIYIIIIIVIIIIIINNVSLRTCKCSSEWNPLDCCYLVHGQEVRAHMIVFGTLDKVTMYNNFTKHSKYIVNIWWNHINYVGRTNILIWHLYHIYMHMYVCVWFICTKIYAFPS
jgi:hypothetical protein